jgi:hypothetical protein
LKTETATDSAMTEMDLNSGKGEHQGERRRSTRYLIRGAAWFQWQTLEGQKLEGTGVTRNVSKAGTFIESAEIPAVGSQLKVMVSLSGGRTDDIQARLCGVGDVRHLQQDAERPVGFGGWVVFHTESPA